MDPIEIPSVYFEAAKEQTTIRQRRDLLEQGLRAMGSVEESKIRTGNMMILCEGGCHE